MYEEEYLLNAIVYILIGWLGFKYSEIFLRRKYDNRARALLLWIAAYTLGQIVYERITEFYPLYERFTHVVSYLILLPVL